VGTAMPRRRAKGTRKLQALQPERRCVASQQEKLFRALIFLVLGGGARVTIQSVYQEEWSVGLSLDDWFDQLFGFPVAIFLTEFVTGLPVLRVFGIESSFNSTLELSRIRITNCFFVFAQ
jgi:hypothetical protein